MLGLELHCNRKKKGGGGECRDSNKREKLYVVMELGSISEKCHEIKNEYYTGWGNFYKILKVSLPW